MIEFGLAACASAAWGASDFAAGLAARRLPVLMVLAASLATGLVLALAVLLISGAGAPSSAALRSGAPAGAFEAVGFGALYAALARGPIGVVAPIAGLGAVLPLVTGVIGGHPFGLLGLVGCVTALLAVVLVAGSTGEATTQRVVPGVALALAAAAAFGTFSMLIDRAADQAPFVWGVAVARAVAVGVVLPVLAWHVWRPATRTFTWPGSSELGTLVLVGALDVTANLFFAWGASRAHGPLVAVVGSTYPVCTVLLAAGFLGERLAATQRLGVLLAVAATALLIV